MKNFTRLLGIAIVSGGVMANLPAKADTAYHAVYHQPITSTDLFSKLDKYQNNALTPDELKVGGPVAFDVVDTNRDGFVTRDEFYNYYNRTAVNVQTPEQMTEIQPAAGGTTEYATGTTMYTTAPVTGECVYTDNAYCETRPY